MIIDTHTHLFCEEFEEDLPEVIDRAISAGVEKLFMPNIDVSTLDRLLHVCDCYPETCLPMLGLHPTSVDAGYKDELSLLKQYLLRPNRFVAIGEVGLDLYWDTTFSQEQVDAFNEQIHWAMEFNLPLVIHCRKAFPKLIECLEPYKETSLRGIFHSFTGDDGDVCQLLSFKNFLFGINGVVTFKKSKLPAVLRSSIPLDRLVVETDSPYLAPVPHRGQRNESAYVRDVLIKVAEIYEITVDEAAAITSENACRLFCIK